MIILKNNHTFSLEVTAQYHSNKQISVRTLSADQISGSAGASGDAIKALETMPGVSVSPQTDMPVYRGVSPEYSKFYLDNNEVPYLFHDGGYKSVLPSGVLSDITLYPSGFGIKYGNGIGGIVLATSDTILKNRINGNFDVSSIDFGGYIKGNITPILQLSAGGRISDKFGIMKRYVKEFEGDKGLVPTYADYFGKLQYTFLKYHKLDITFLGSHDNMTAVHVDRLDPKRIQSFNQITFNWVRARKRNFSFDVHFATIFSGIERASVELYSYGKRHNIYFRGISLPFRLQWFPNEKTQVSVGYIYEEKDILNGTEIYLVKADTTILSVNKYPDIHLGVWAQYESNPIEKLKFKLGGRYDIAMRPDIYGSKYPAFTPSDNNRINIPADPSIRASAWWSINNNNQIRIQVGNYTSFPDWKTELYQPDNSVPSTKSLHTTIGYNLQTNSAISLDIEGYINPRWAMAYELEQDSTGKIYYNGEGVTRGVEFLLKFNRTEHFEGWLAYTLSKSLETKNGISSLSDYDQTNNIQFVGNLFLPKAWKIGTRVGYITGNPYTPIESVVKNSSNSGNYYYTPIKGDLNGSRLKPSIILGLRIAKTIIRKRATTEIYFDCNNCLYPIYKTPRYQIFSPITGEIDSYYQPPLPSLGVKISF